ncbi:MAG: HipA domain-containing protein [Candidatus Melainabacteria bacterium]|nr:HipA domain-containing protein [Candidatus Melainabacteria bacterium]
MTSSCFVYITLPGEVENVTAGQFQLTTDQKGIALGQFVYGKKYLSRNDAVEIDPIELKLQERLYGTARLGGVFGALRDAGPDYWGRLVIEKHSGRPILGEIDYLLESPDDRAGALSFGLGTTPPAPKRKFNKTIDLDKLQRLAHDLVQDELDSSDPDATQIQELLLLGTSMGGARPKAVVEDESGLWVAKFSRPDDRWNNPRVEFAMLELARQCGISVARSCIENIGGKDVLFVHRFDREKTRNGYARARMISGLTLLRAEDSVQKRDRWSYVVMSEELRRVVSQPKKDAAELFRRMCFNALISNIDDHPRNHALIAMDREWKLSPAYDLTPSPVVSEDQRDLAMTCGAEQRFANKRNLLSECMRFLLSRDEATQIISSMEEKVESTWYDVVRACGVSVKDAETITRAFVYPGFKR